MSLMQCASTRWAGGIALAITATLALTEVRGDEQIPDFCFLQVSDIHINPQPVGAPDPGPGDRSIQELAWFRGAAAKPQVLGPSGITTPVPSFVIATGDLTEYGAIHKTWDNFEALFKPLPLPLYVTPGNHDNTWTPIEHIMRARHGGDHYSFDQFGCHFASINTATPSDPVPSIEARTLNWLRHDLADVDAPTPVFIFCHHPLSSGEFATPHEQLRLLEVLRGHNVVLLLMGHGHTARHQRWGPLDSVMGGETFRKNVGYNVISVIDGVLRVVYRYRDPARGVELLLEKPIQRPRLPKMTIMKPGGAGVDVCHTGALPVAAKVAGAPPKTIVASLDGGDRIVDLKPTGSGGRESGPFEGILSLEDELPGYHFIRVTAEFGKATLDQARQVQYVPADAQVYGQRVAELAAGVKGQPLIAGKEIIVATTAGQVFKGPGSDLAKKGSPLFEAGVEILHVPALADDRLYLSAAEKGVLALGLDGHTIWRCPVGAVVYGTPAVDDEYVYVGDLEGTVHAIERQRGQLIWSQHHAQYSIEQPLCLHSGVLYFGAWDGFVYALNAADGTLRWKRGGPASYRAEGKYKSRYYAPGDCSPLVIGDALFVVDRAYIFGSYSLAGEYRGEIADQVAAIGPSADGNGVLARGLTRGLTRYNGRGEALWNSPAEAGRFPIAPTEAGGKVYVCSNHGLLSAHDAASGAILWRYQVTPRLPVMAPVAADEEGNVYVAGMDGTVTRLTRAEKK
jgi:outer membrane protein assembly factor BamB